MKMMLHISENDEKMKKKDEEDERKIAWTNE